MSPLSLNPRIAICDMYPRRSGEPTLPVRRPGCGIVPDAFDPRVPATTKLDLGRLAAELTGLRGSIDVTRTLLQKDLGLDGSSTFRSQLSRALETTHPDAFSGPGPEAPFVELDLPRPSDASDASGTLLAGDPVKKKKKAKLSDGKHEKKSEKPSFWKKVMWWGIADLGVSLLDYVGYNLFRPKADELAKNPDAKVSPLYRVFQGAVQGFTGGLLAKHLGPGTAAAFAVSQWTAGNDFLYYGWGALADRLGIRPEGWDKGAGNLLNEKPDWFNWTPQGLLFGQEGADGKRRVDGSVVAMGSLLGIPLSLALMGPEDGFLGTPVKDRKGWLADILNTLVP